MDGRTLRWLGRGLLIVGILAAMWGWYLYAQRLKLDDDNRRELSHAARDLSKILSELSSTAKDFFGSKARTSKTQSTVERIQQFVARNPYFVKQIPEKLAAKFKTAQPNTFCPSLKSPKYLLLSKDGMLGLPINTKAIFADVAISDAFDYLFIADADGEVQFAMEYGAAALRRQDTGWIDSRAREHPDLEYPVIGITGIKGLATLNAKALDPGALKQAVAMQSVRLGQDAYELFTYPITLTPPDCGKANSWIVGGLVNPGRMWREAATISPRWTLILLLSFLLASVAKPFVKVWLLRPTERFRFTDACMVLPSATLLLMMSTALLIESGAHARLASLAAGGLESLSLEVEKKMIGNFQAMRKQLVDFDRGLAGVGCAMDMKGEGLAKNDIPNLLLKDSALGPPREYRDLIQVAWMNSSGRQIFKAVIYPQPTPRLDVSTRPYFTQIQEGHTWKFSNDSAGDEPFLVQSSRSLTTADLQTGLSINSRLGGDCRKGDVAVISAKPLWIERPFLPSGYDFAVIASDGEVIYHSDRRRMVKENLFEEIEDPTVLRSAVLAGADLHMTTIYDRQPVELYIRPLKSLQGAHWFIVTLRDERWLEGVSTEALVHIFTWSLVPWFASLLVASIAAFSGKKALKQWWPDPHKTGLYRALSIGYVAAFVAGLMCIRFSPAASPWLFRMSLGFPLLPALITIILNNNAVIGRKVSGSSATHYRKWYVAALAGMWAASAVVPAAGLSRYSWHRELDKLGQFESKRSTQHDEDWKARDRQQYRDAKVQMPDSSFLNERFQRLRPHAEPLARAGRGTAWEQWLDVKLPIYSETIASTRNQEPRVQPTGTDASLATMAYPDAEMGWNATSVVGCGFVLLLAALWLRFNARNLFWMYLDPPPSPTDPKDPKSPEDHQGPEEPEALRARGACAILLNASIRERQELALRLESPQAMAATGFGESSSLANTSSVIVDFETVREEPSAREFELSRMEEARANHGGVFILACSDPVHFFAESAVDNSQADPSPSERERWLRLLAPFKTQTQAIAAVLSDAEAESFWRCCTRAEKLTLIHVAQEGFANPRQGAVVQTLRDKGVLKLDPNLQLANREFEKFVKRMAGLSDVERWEEPRGGTGWKGVRWIFALTLLGAVLFLAGTQQSWFKGATATMAAVGGGLEALWKMLQSVQGLHASK